MHIQDKKTLYDLTGHKNILSTARNEQCFQLIMILPKRYNYIMY
jgi:hypothetical protein